MVQASIGSVGELVHNSFTKALAAPQLLTVSSLNKTRLTPLMAQPYEVVNVTSGNTTSGGQGTNKPPDKPNG